MHFLGVRKRCSFCGLSSHYPLHYLIITLSMFQKCSVMFVTSTAFPTALQILFGMENCNQSVLRHEGNMRLSDVVYNSLKVTLCAMYVQISVNRIAICAYIRDLLLVSFLRLYFLFLFVISTCMLFCVYVFFCHSHNQLATKTIKHIRLHYKQSLGGYS